MKTIISHITAEQWSALAQLVEERLREQNDRGRPLELSYELVKHLMGFTGNVDFYLALWHHHQHCDPKAGFWFHGNHRPGELPLSLLFYPRGSNTS